MQTEARVGVVVEGGGQRALCSGHGGGGVAVDGGARKYQQQQQQQQQQHRQQQQIGTLPHLLAGGIAGAFSKTCTAPLARLTILFQVQGMHSDVATLRKASIWREASRIVYEEGVGAFWKGNLVTIAHRLPYSSISFYAYEHYKSLLQSVPVLDRHKDYATADISVRLLGGGLAGITAACITYPLDLIRTRLAAQTNTTYYRGISHALYAIWRDEGVRGLYKGLGATLLGVGPNIAISFSAYEKLRSHWQLRRPHDSTLLVSLACGSLSGIASSTGYFLNPQFRYSSTCREITDEVRMGVNEVIKRVLTDPNEVIDAMTEMDYYNKGVGSFADSVAKQAIKRQQPMTFPLDLVRRRMQLEGVAGRARVYNSGLFGAFAHIFRTEGFRGLYRGILPEYYKVVPSVGIVFMTYEMLKSCLSETPPND